ncbi:MAG TPA: CD225/dispanin family protein [Thermoanaerobaculia bacterium]|nr:CD225/dispanin family protein [Thermoanaerobaculia bacterium]
MNCPNCGTNNLDNASVCVNCGRSLMGGAAQSYTPPPPPSYGTPGGGEYGGGPAAPGTVPNYLVQSIIVTLCCCLPLGVVAIIFSAQVNSKLAAGDIAGARDASQKAKMFAWIGFGLGIVAMIIWFAMSGTAVLQGIRDAQANR